MNLLKNLLGVVTKFSKGVLVLAAVECPVAV
jgi:hypothetical protein